jgi:hypothetical protein
MELRNIVPRAVKIWNSIFRAMYRIMYMQAMGNPGWLDASGFRALAKMAIQCSNLDRASTAMAKMVDLRCEPIKARDTESVTL